MKKEEAMKLKKGDRITELYGFDKGLPMEVLEIHNWYSSMESTIMITARPINPAKHKSPIWKMVKENDFDCRLVRKVG